MRWEIRDHIHEAFLSLAYAIICWRRLQNLSLCQYFLGRGRRSPLVVIPGGHLEAVP
jgi:hypothetical protein